MHLDLPRGAARRGDPGRGRDRARGRRGGPGVKEGGVLEHVTREITVEALPTEIPERIVVDVSAMEINDTLQLSRRSPSPRASSSMADDPEEITIATLSPAARRGGARARGRGGGRAGRRGRGGSRGRGGRRGRGARARARRGRGRGRRCGRAPPAAAEVVGAPASPRSVRRGQRDRAAAGRQPRRLRGDGGGDGGGGGD